MGNLWFPIPEMEDSNLWFCQIWIYTSAWNQFFIIKWFKSHASFIINKIHVRLKIQDFQFYHFIWKMLKFKTHESPMGRFFLQNRFYTRYKTNWMSCSWWRILHLIGSFLLMIQNIRQNCLCTCSFTLIQKFFPARMFPHLTHVWWLLFGW